MAPRHHQGHKGKGGNSFSEPQGGDVGLQMVDSGQGNLQTIGHGFGHGHTHHQGPDEAGALGGRQTVHLLEANPGLVQGSLDHRRDIFQVAPGRQLRDHAAIHRVQLKLGGHHTPQQAPPVLHHRGRGLVTGCLDS